MKKKILYVDDENVNLYIFRMTFRDAYEIIGVESARAGLEVLKEQSDIPIVISDLRMPVMDGLEFIAAAKALYPAIRFNLLTGYQKTKEIEDAISAGLVNKYFSKPFNKQEIIEEFETP